MALNKWSGLNKWGALQGAFKPYNFLVNILNNITGGTTMYPRNATNPERVLVGQVVLIVDGTVQSSGVAITIRGQGGSEAAGVGTIVYGADNSVYYTPTQAETNFTSFVIIASKALCFSASQTIITTASSTSGNVVLSPQVHTGAVIPTVTLVDTTTTNTDMRGTDNISSGAGGISTVATGVVVTTGTQTNTYTSTQELDGTSHDIAPSGGNTEFYYDFFVGVSGVSTTILWNGHAESNGDEYTIKGYDWVSSTFKVIGTISASNNTAVIERDFIVTAAMTGTGANAGVVRFQVTSANATNFSTDRILCEYTSLPEAGVIFNSGVAQSGGNNRIQLASGAVTADNQFVRSKIILIGGTGSGQEAIITDSEAATDTLTVTPAWQVNPDATTAYEVIPGQVHTTVRNGGYDNGYVYVDVVNGSAGTLKGVNGTSTNKSSVLADARTIANEENIRKYNIEGGGAWSLDQSYTNWIFDHVSASLINLNSQDVSGSVFMRSGITGVGISTTRSIFELCGLGSATLGVCNFLQCGFSGVTTLSSEDRYLGWDCFENGESTPVIDIAGDGVTQTTLELVNYSGRIEIQNATAVDVIVITGQAHVTLNANCSGGTLTKAGDVKVTDNSGNMTIVLSDIDAILIDTPAKVLAAGDVDGYSLEEALKLLLSASTGVLAGAATNTITISAADGSKTRLTATVDNDGNRSVVVKDATG